MLAFVKSLAENSAPVESKDLWFLENFEKNPDDNLTPFVIDLMAEFISRGERFFNQSKRKKGARCHTPALFLSAR